MSSLIRGTHNADFLLGTIGDDFILGLQGNDDIRADIGNDTVHGGKGNDLIYGGGATDAPDRDILLGEQGQDTIYGQSGNDYIDGGVDGDLLGGDGGDDTVLGGPGNDTVEGGYGNDLVRGGPDNDLVIGAWGNDTLYGDSGDDVIDGVLEYTGTYNGKGEIDTLFGNGGNDVFVLGGGKAYDQFGKLMYQSKQVYYDDGTVMGAPLGTDDYAIIKDFKVGHDVIQLYGTKPIPGFPPGEYLTRSVGGSVEIYRNYASPSLDHLDELIAVVQGVKSLDLYSNSFVYVT